MEKKPDFLEFQRKVNTLLGMPFYTYSPKVFGERFGQLLTVCHRHFTEIIVIVVTIGQYWAVPHVLEDMNVLCGCLASGSHCTQVVAKSTFLTIRKKRYLAHLERVHVLQENIDLFERSVFHRNPYRFVEFHKKQSRYINIIVIVQLVVNFVSTSAYFLPFVYESIVNHEEVRRMLTPIVVYMGIDFNYTPYFQIVVIVLTVAFYVNNLKTVVIDNFFLSIIVLHMSQLKYHSNLLREIMETSKTGGNVKQYNKEKITTWIKYHQDMLSLCQDFRNLISPYLFLEFSYILIHTCVPAFVITSTFSWTLPQKISVFFMVGGGLVELFLMSNAGDDLSKAWDAVGNDLIESEYFFENEKWMRNVFLMIRKRLSQPFRLGALNIIPLSCATFATIMRLIFSYYMTLNQIQKIKRNDLEILNDGNFALE